MHPPSALSKLVLALGLVTAWAGFIIAAPQFPALTGRVVDEANLLNTEDRATLTAQLEALEAKTTDQLVVVTLSSLQGYPIEEFGYQLGRHWGIGQAGKNNGVLLIIAPNEREVRIEVGYGLEPTLTDALSKIITENVILPRFREGDYAAGIKEGVGDIIKVLSGEAEAVKAKAREPEQVSLLVIAVWMLMWAIVIWHIWRTIRRLASGTPVSGRSWGGSSGGSSGWSSGSGSGNSSRGFSGGGGSFGGGGASGRW